MRVWAKRVLLAGLAVIVVAQIIPVGRTNPPADSSQAIVTKMVVPPEIATILDRACQDCHSNHTTWPWYSQVAPVSWFLVRDVNAGRRELNFSDWGRYTARRQDRKLKEICEQVEKGDMPMFAYTLLHPQAKVTTAERKTMCAWTTAARQNVGATATTTP